MLKHPRTGSLHGWVNMATGNDIFSTQYPVALANMSHRASMIQAVYSKAAEYYPSPHEFRQELPKIDDDAASTVPSKSTVAAALKITPEVKLLTEEDQSIWVAIEVEGVLHNKRPLPDQAIDVIFVIDNA